jgi:hypothetical protein
MKPPEPVSKEFKPPWHGKDTKPPQGFSKATERFCEVEIVDPLVDREWPVHTKLNCEAFARQYIIDFNQKRAAIRMGYDEQSANVMGNHLFWHSYTQAYLVALIRGMEETTIVGRNEVLAGLLREAHAYGMDASSATRIAAWKEIAKILGMYVARIEISQNSSGVMEVPLVRDVNEWEQISAVSQGMLMEAARS